MNSLVQKLKRLAADHRKEYGGATEESVLIDEAAKELNRLSAYRIEKQIRENTAEGREFIDFVCPTCGNTLQQAPKIAAQFSYRSFVLYKYDFCPDCGQALSWEKG